MVRALNARANFIADEAELRVRYEDEYDIFMMHVGFLFNQFQAPSQNDGRDSPIFDGSFNLEH